MNKKIKTFPQDIQDPEIQCLEKVINDNKSKRMHIRYIVIYNHLKGYSNKEISKIEKLCDHTVGKYINAYKQQGLQGLAIGKSTGKPRFLNEEQEKALVEVITAKTPDEVGFRSRKNWDCNLIAQWIFATYGIKYEQRSILDVLYHLNLSYTRPTYTLEKADPKKQDEFKQEFEELKKRELKKTH